LILDSKSLLVLRTKISGLKVQIQARPQSLKTPVIKTRGTSLWFACQPFIHAHEPGRPGPCRTSLPKAWGGGSDFDDSTIFVDLAIYLVQFPNPM
jgi:hypothetical protein